MRFEEKLFNLVNSKKAIRFLLSGFLLFPFLLAIFLAIYGGLIFFDLSGPMSIYDKKFIDIYENIDNQGQQVGTILIIGVYQSKGVISSNKEIEFFVYEVNYGLNKESFKDPVVWRDNITAEICPDNAKAYGDTLYQKTQCINVVLNKIGSDISPIEYRNITQNQNNIEFKSSGQKALRVGVRGIPIGSYYKDKVFEIEPYSTYLQIQLQKYMYILALLGFAIILFQFYDLIIKYIKK